MHGVWSMFEQLSSDFRAISRDLDVDGSGSQKVPYFLVNSQTLGGHISITIGIPFENSSDLDRGRRPELKSVDWGNMGARGMSGHFCGRSDTRFSSRGHVRTPVCSTGRTEHYLK